MKGRGREAEAAGLVAGFALWALGFSLLYGAHGLACSLGVAPGPARAALAMLFAAHLAAQAGLGLWLWRRWRAADQSARFVRFVSLLLAAAAAGAAAWTGAPVLALSICS